MRRLVAIASCLLACAFGAAGAAPKQAPGAAPESVYVIDRLLVGVHKDPEPTSPITQVFATGAKLEVLERKGSMARVRGPKGEAGWVDAEYLMPEMPARLVAAILEDKNRELEEENQVLKAQLAGTPAAAASAPAQCATTERAEPPAGAPAEPARDCPAPEATAGLASLGTEVTALALVTLALGFGCGAYTLDYLQRRRHGGFRL